MSVWQRFADASPGARGWALILGAVHVGLVIAFCVGWLTGSWWAGDPEEGEEQVVAEEEAETLYTCSMHPDVRKADPNATCPICGMALIPVGEDEGGDADVPRLRATPRAEALMQVQTAPVLRRFVDREVRLFGKIQVDETRLHDVVVRSEGEVRQLFLNYLHAPVRRGEHLADVYSPAVLNASEELALAADGGSDLLAAARRRLSLLGVSNAQIGRVVEHAQPLETYTLHSPVDGVVVEVSARQGEWVGRGEPLMRIAGLSQVWVVLEAYESDIPWLRYGQTAVIKADALPGQRFEGMVTFIAPEVDDASRTARVRISLPNPDGSLKPGMFVRAVVPATVTDQGRAMAPHIEDFWMCPMHPEVVGDGPGSCSICGMPLEEASSLGHLGDPHADPPLVVPATAPLLTGRRALVYVEVDDEEQRFWEPRQVELGPRAGDFYVVLEGLEEGDRVVTHGAFRIDSELQILGRPSMMSASEPERPDYRDALPSGFGAHLEELLQAYTAASDALAADDSDDARHHASELHAKLEAQSLDGLTGEARAAWLSARRELAQGAHGLTGSENLSEAREAFDGLSTEMGRVIASFGTGGLTIVPIECPMAFDGVGAVWLQTDDEVRNPYHGSEMLRCGEVQPEVKDPSPPAAGGMEHHVH